MGKLYEYDTISGRFRFFCSKEEAHRIWYHSQRNARYAYFALNHHTGLCVPFQTKKELIFWWNRSTIARQKHSIDELNVTGKDVYVLYKPWEKYPEPERWLRPLQIFDADFRSIDVRNWNMSNSGFFPVSGISWHTKINTRSKCHTHRKRGPKGDHRTQLADQMLTGYPGVKARKNAMSSADVWDYYEDAHAEDYCCSKCWKDQSKARKQWAKHKHWHPEEVQKELVDPWEGYE